MKRSFLEVYKIPAVNKFHIHGFQVVSLFKICIKFKSNVFITYLLQEKKSLLMKALVLYTQQKHLWKHQE